MIDSVVDADGERLSEFREKITAERTTNATRFSTFKNEVSTSIDRASGTSTRARGVLALALVAFVVAAVDPALDRRSPAGGPATPRWGDVVLAALGACAIVNAALLHRRRHARAAVAPALEERADSRPSAGTPSAAT